MRRAILAALILALVCVPAWAGTRDRLFSADGGIRFAGGGGYINWIDALADGSATVEAWIWDAAGDSFKAYCAGTDTLLYLRDGIPRFLNFGTARVDSAYVDLLTATEAIISWNE